MCATLGGAQMRLLERFRCLLPALAQLLRQPVEAAHRRLHRAQIDGRLRHASTARRGAVSAAQRGDLRALLLLQLSTPELVIS